VALFSVIAIESNWPCFRLSNTVGFGYTDEEVTRITPERALNVMECVLGSSQHALEYWTKRFQETQDSYAQQGMTEQTQEVNRLTQELASLKKLLSIGE
jgi:hypothetical protein